MEAPTATVKNIDNEKVYELGNISKLLVCYRESTLEKETFSTKTDSDWSKILRASK